MLSLTKARRLPLFASIAAGTLMLAGCVGSTPYAPATGQGFSRQGYYDQQLEANRFLVGFSGNSYTSRDTVEKYLLFRAAELTLQNGDDYFILTNRDTDKQTQTYVTQPFGPGPYGYWGPSWRFYGAWGRYGGLGWRSWDPFWGDPFFNDVNVNTVQKFDATAEIIVGRGPKPANNPRAFDAHQVAANLGPTIKVPR